jgi:hypothetical protein
MINVHPEAPAPDGLEALSPGSGEARPEEGSTNWVQTTHVDSAPDPGLTLS